MAYLALGFSALRQSGVRLENASHAAADLNVPGLERGSDDDSESESDQEHTRVSRLGAASAQAERRSLQIWQYALVQIQNSYINARHRQALDAVWDLPPMLEFTCLRDELRQACILTTDPKARVRPKQRELKLQKEKQKFKRMVLAEADVSEALSDVEGWIAANFGTRVLSVMHALRQKILAAAEFVLGSAGAAELHASFLCWRLPGLMINAMALAAGEVIDSQDAHASDAAATQGAEQSPAGGPSTDGDMDWLLAPWQSPDSIEVWLHEQRLQAVALYCIADELLHASVQQHLGNQLVRCLSDLHLKEELEELPGSSQPAYQLLSEAAFSHMLASCEGVAWLQVAAHCLLAAAEARKAGQRIDPDPRVSVTLPWLPAVVAANGPWVHSVTDNPIALATSMITLRIAMQKGVPSALILPHPPPMVVTANVVSDSEILAPGREGHGLLLALAGCSSKEGKWAAVQTCRLPSGNEAEPDQGNADAFERHFMAMLLVDYIPGESAWAAAKPLWSNHEFEDLCMRLLAPQGYAHMAAQLQKRRKVPGAHRTEGKAPPPATDEALLQGLHLLLRQAGGCVLPAAALVGSKQLQDFLGAVQRVQQLYQGEGRDLMLLPLLQPHTAWEEEVKAVVQFRKGLAKWDASAVPALESACALLYPTPRDAGLVLCINPEVRHCDGRATHADGPREKKKMAERLMSEPAANAFGEAPNLSSWLLRALRLVVVECPTGRPDKPCMPRQGQELIAAIERLRALVHADVEDVVQQGKDLTDTVAVLQELGALEDGKDLIHGSLQHHGSASDDWQPPAARRSSAGIEDDFWEPVSAEHASAFGSQGGQTQQGRSGSGSGRMPYDFLQRASSGGLVDSSMLHFDHAPASQVQAGDGAGGSGPSPPASDPWVTIPSQIRNTEADAQSLPQLQAGSLKGNVCRPLEPWEDEWPAEVLEALCLTSLASAAACPTCGVHYSSGHDCSSVWP